MKFEEKKMDLFDVNTMLMRPVYCLAHCISADFGMFGGIVVGFNERWDMKNVLMSNYINVEDDFSKSGGLCIPVEVKDWGRDTVVYNLITKKTVGSLPTYDNLEKSLNRMKQHMLAAGHKNLAIPKIGCGIDRLEWIKVKELIFKVFEETDISILVCYK